jgi:hypothetical protein
LVTAYAARFTWYATTVAFTPRGGAAVAERASPSLGLLAAAISPSLNLIERLWGHLKRTVLANVLYHTLNDLVAAFRKGVRRITGNRDHMGFMFDHDDLTQQVQAKARKLAA